MKFLFKMPVYWKKESSTIRGNGWAITVGRLYGPYKHADCVHGPAIQVNDKVKFYSKAYVWTSAPLPGKISNSKLCASCACLDFHKCIHNWTIRAWSSAWGKATFRPDWVGPLAPWCVEERLEAEEGCGGWPEEAWEDEVEEVYWGELYPLEVCFYLTRFVTQQSIKQD